MSTPLRTQIPNLLDQHPKNPNALLRVHSLLGYLYSTTAKRFLREHHIPMEAIHLLAARADSIPPPVAPPMHHPIQASREAAPAFESWTAIIAAETAVTTVSNLPMTRRSLNETDPVVGPPLDFVFLQHPDKNRVCLSISELLDITIIPHMGSEVIAPPSSSTCGPGTLYIDYTTRYATSNQVHNDNNGTYAQSGTVNQVLVDRFFEHNDYSERIPPLRVATEMFGHHEAQNFIDECVLNAIDDHDIVATMTRITAENIVRQYNRLVAKHCPPDQTIQEVFICGAGARNMAVVDYIEESLPKEVITRPLEDIGIPGDAKDTVCCAQLGLETILKFAANEGGPFELNHQSRLLGEAVRGKNWNSLRSYITKLSNGREVFAVQRVVVEK